MSISRHGKIARLPYHIREELNRRLRDGKSGPALLKWLNEDAECGEVLDEEFEGRAITKQNLSEWRQGGYEDWVRKEQARERVQVLMEKAEDLEDDAGGMAIADRLGTLLSAELAVAMEQLGSIPDPKERWVRLKEIAREVYRLRREDHHARKLRMVEAQYERRQQEAEKEKLLKLQAAMKNKPMMASIDGNSDEAWDWADWTIRVTHGLPMPVWWTEPQTAEEWSELMMPYWIAKRNGNRPKSEVQSPKSKRVRPGPSESNQKSGSVQPSPAESKVEESGRVEGNEAAGTGSQMGDMGKIVAGGPSESGAVQPSPGEIEDENENENENEDERQP